MPRNGYLALIGDVVASKALRGRADFQRRLQRELERLTVANPAVVSPYTITLGDEFQAVYERASGLWADVLALTIAAHPVRIRFAIGVGTLSTDVNPRQAIGMDGPAFHAAREAMTELKANGRLLRLGGLAAPIGLLTNHALDLFSGQTDAWRPNRWEVLRDRLLEVSPADTAARLGISTTAVHKNVGAGDLDTVVSLLIDIARIIGVESVALPK